MEAAADLTWKGYSVAERDRRWKAVRERGAAAGLDCVFVPLGDGLDGEYLTGFTTAVVVMPTDGRLPIVIQDHKGATNAWIRETRYANREWAQLSAQALLDAGMERARIGVVGLKGGTVTHVRAPGGVVVHTPYAQDVKGALPHATFEDATDVVGFVRYVKSDEEIECLRRSAALAEAGVERMVELARPGLDEAVLYASVTERMLELGSAYYDWALETGPLGHEEVQHRSTVPPVGRRLKAGELVNNEVTAIFGSMLSQEVQPILLGPLPQDWQPLIDLQREVFEAGLDRMRPGVTFGELIDFTNGFSKRPGLNTAITLHGRGMGDDGPLITARASGSSIRDLALQKGNAFVWKPYAQTPDARWRFNFGATVVIGENGAERLSSRPPGMICIE
ncbi:MAG TPA: M24 family metallopeptidase [Chloroflexota bacterium]